MPVTATHIRDDASGFPFSFEEPEAGKYTGVRSYLVETANPVEAMTDSGVPLVNSAWPGGPSTLILRDRKYRYITGDPDTLGEGRCVVECRYSSSGSKGQIFIPNQPDAVTELQIRSSSIQARFPIERLVNTGAVGAAPPLSDASWTTSSPPYDPINEGDGAPLKMAEIEVRVHYYQLLTNTLASYSTPISRLLNLCRPAKLNLNAITLPRLQNTGTPGVTASGERLAMAAGQLQYESFEIGEFNGFRRLTHIMTMAEDFYYRSQVTKQDGSPGELRADRLNDYADFAALWPT